VGHQTRVYDEGPVDHGILVASTSAYTAPIKAMSAARQGDVLSGASETATLRKAMKKAAPAPQASNGCGWNPACAFGNTIGNVANNLGSAASSVGNGVHDVATWVNHHRLETLGIIAAVAIVAVTCEFTCEVILGAAATAATETAATGSVYAGAAAFCTLACTATATLAVPMIQLSANISQAFNPNSSDAFGSGPGSSDGTVPMMRRARPRLGLDPCEAAMGGGSVRRRYGEGDELKRACRYAS
jgi:hypothetical protein